MNQVYRKWATELVLISVSLLTVSTCLVIWSGKSWALLVIIIMSSDHTLRSLFAQITVFLGVQLIHERCLSTHVGLPSNSLSTGNLPTFRLLSEPTHYSQFQIIPTRSLPSVLPMTTNTDFERGHYSQGWAHDLPQALFVPSSVLCAYRK